MTGIAINSNRLILLCVENTYMFLDHSNTLLLPKRNAAGPVIKKILGKTARFSVSIAVRFNPLPSMKMADFASAALLLLLLMLTPVPRLFGQDVAANYDEAKTGTYTLPDPLQAKNGRKVTSVKGWETVRRPELLRLFAENIYGRMPGKPAGLHFRVTSVDSNALGGKAIRKLITVYFTQAADSPRMEVLLYLPKNARAEVPVFTSLNFCGNHCITTDASIPLSTRWVANNPELGIQNHQATEASRGQQQRRWPLATILERGYGVATAYYGDLEPDHPEGWQTGIRSTMETELKISAPEWGAISAWAWGMSRMLDYLETDPAVNARQVIAMGHSRLGKAALWAGANDQRFAAVIANESGEGGAALARRWYGETVQRITTAFPHWFMAKYQTYGQNPGLLPVDQHQLLALVAPRPLYVASAEEDRWSDPRGEFLGAKGAEPVYRLYQKNGLGIIEMPGINQPVGQTIHYHIRSGKHDVTDFDWEQYLRFADTHMGKK